MSELDSEEGYLLIVHQHICGDIIDCYALMFTVFHHPLQRSFVLLKMALKVRHQIILFVPILTS